LYMTYFGRAGDPAGCRVDRTADNPVAVRARRRRWTPEGGAARTPGALELTRPAKGGGTENAGFLNAAVPRRVQTGRSTGGGRVLRAAALHNGVSRSTIATSLLPTTLEGRQNQVQALYMKYCVGRDAPWGCPLPFSGRLPPRQGVSQDLVIQILCRAGVLRQPVRSEGRSKPQGESSSPAGPLDPRGSEGLPRGFGKYAKTSYRRRPGQDGKRVFFLRKRAGPS